MMLFSGIMHAADQSNDSSAPRFLSKPLFSKADLGKALFSRAWATAKYPVATYAGAVTVLHTLKAEVSSYSRWIFGAVVASFTFGLYQGHKDFKAARDEADKKAFEKEQETSKHLERLHTQRNQELAVRANISYLESRYTTQAQALEELSSRKTKAEATLKELDHYKEQLCIAHIPADVAAASLRIQKLIKRSKEADLEDLNNIADEINVLTMQIQSKLATFSQIPQNALAELFSKQSNVGVLFRDLNEHARKCEVYKSDLQRLLDGERSMAASHQRRATQTQLEKAAFVAQLDKIKRSQSLTENISSSSSSSTQRNSPQDGLKALL